MLELTLPYMISIAALYLAAKLITAGFIGWLRWINKPGGKLDHWADWISRG